MRRLGLSPDNLGPVPEILLKQKCHTPIPGPTRLVDPNRVPRSETIYWDTLPDFFFLKVELVPVGMTHIL